MGEEVPLAVGKLIGGAVADAIVALIGTDEECAAAVGQIFSVLVKIGTCDRGATPI